MSHKYWNWTDFFFFFYWKWLESYLNCLKSRSGMGEGNLTCWKGSGRRKNTAASCLYSLYSTLSIDWLHIYWFSCSHKITNGNPQYIPNVRVKRRRITGRAWRDRFLSSRGQREMRQLTSMSSVSMHGTPTLLLVFFKPQPEFINIFLLLSCSSYVF